MPSDPVPNTVRISTPLGEMLLVANKDGLTHALFADVAFFRLSAASLQESPENPILQEASRQIAQYFHSMRRQFTVPLCPEGSDFDKQVWSLLEKIVFGSYTTYKKIAQMLGSPKAARAVGAACSRNPIAIIIPCHRVLGSRQNLVGYAGGVQRKNSLLNLEHALDE
jgi:methylated-DNA-[protein]-cysteine S-methyltransferase